jgi:hypothetical protein
MPSFMMHISRIHLLIILISILTLPVFAQNVLLTDHLGSGSYEFGQEMKRLYLASRENQIDSLTIRPIKESSERLVMLENRQAGLAILDAKSAHLYLGKNSRFRVVTVLWPNFLHVIVNRVTSAQPSILNAQTLLAHPNAIRAAQVWTSMVTEGQLTWWDQQHYGLQDQGMLHDGMLVSAPVPLKEIQEILKSFSTLSLASLEPAFVLRMRQNSPWWKKWKLGKGFYPGQSQTLDGLVSFSVLVARVDFHPDQTEQWLKTLFQQREKLNPHILFRNLDVKHNSLFKDKFYFHSRSISFFGF